MSLRKNLLKVVILGDPGVGKTSLMNQFVHNKFSSHYKATIGADFLTKEIVVNNQMTTMQIWDTAGQERFASLGSAFFRGADICFLVYDVTSGSSFEHLDRWKKDFIDQSGIQNENSFPFFLLGNKSDLENRVVKQKRAQDWCSANGNFEYFETSAKTNFEVEQVFHLAAQKGIENDSIIEVDIHKTIILPKQNTNTKNSPSCKC